MSELLVDVAHELHEEHNAEQARLAAAEEARIVQEAQQRAQTEAVLSVHDAVEQAARVVSLGNEAKAAEKRATREAVSEWVDIEDPQSIKAFQAYLGQRPINREHSDAVAAGKYGINVPTYNKDGARLEHGVQHSIDQKHLEVTLKDTENGYKDMSLAELAKEMAEAKVHGDKTKLQDVSELMDHKIVEFVNSHKSDRSQNELPKGNRKDQIAGLRKRLDRVTATEVERLTQDGSHEAQPTDDVDTLKLRLKSAFALWDVARARHDRGEIEQDQVDLFKNVADELLDKLKNHGVSLDDLLGEMEQEAKSASTADQKTNDHDEPESSKLKTDTSETSTTPEKDDNPSTNADAARKLVDEAQGTDADTKAAKKEITFRETTKDEVDAMDAEELKHIIRRIEEHYNGDATDQLDYMNARLEALKASRPGVKDGGEGATRQDADAASLARRSELDTMDYKALMERYVEAINLSRGGSSQELEEDIRYMQKRLEAIVPDEPELDDKSAEPTGQENGADEAIASGEDEDFDENEWAKSASLKELETKRSELLGDLNGLQALLKFGDVKKKERKSLEQEIKDLGGVVAFLNGHIQDKGGITTRRRLGGRIADRIIGRLTPSTAEDYEPTDMDFIPSNVTYAEARRAQRFVEGAELRQRELDELYEAQDNLHRDAMVDVYPPEVLAQAQANLANRIAAAEARNNNFETREERDDVEKITTVTRS